MNVAVSTKSALWCRWLTSAAAQPPGILPHASINTALYVHIINRWLTDEPPTGLTSDIIISTVNTMRLRRRQHSRGGRRTRNCHTLVVAYAFITALGLDTGQFWSSCAGQSPGWTRRIGDGRI